MERGSSSKRAMSDTSAQAGSTTPNTSKLVSSCTCTTGPLHSISRMPRSAQQAERRHREATMVSYDFKYQKCGTEFEITCHMDEREGKAVCPKCGSRKVEQKLSAAFSSPPPAKY